jgi:hypothetical protein
MTADSLLSETKRCGVKLSRRGDKLVVAPADKCPPELIAMLREHKPEILTLLEAQASGLAPDCAPWLHVARQILAGEFDGCDSSTREALMIRLRSIGHSQVREALEKLEAGCEG